jgi:hypothetical protein
MQVTYVGAHDSVVLLIDGREVECRKGQSIDVPDSVAGHAPAPRVAAAMAELTAAIEAHNHEVAQPLREEIPTLDFGSGLLAQAENWQAMKPKPAPVTTTAKEA